MSTGEYQFSIERLNQFDLDSANKELHSSLPPNVFEWRLHQPSVIPALEKPFTQNILAHVTQPLSKESRLIYREIH